MLVHSSRTLRTKMQCYLCMIYLITIVSAHPPLERDITKPYQRRSLFHDVIESIRIRSRIPENLNQNVDNSLEVNNGNYEFQNELLHLPSDSNFTPRRNDRIEMPPLTYRFPKSLKINKTNDGDTSKEEIVLYINTPGITTQIKTTTQNPRKQTRPKPNNNKISNKNKDDDIAMDERPMTNNLAGQSQIGNRDTQTVIKPTVILNFRGTVNHKESEVRLEGRKSENATNDVLLPNNIFNINQEIKVNKLLGMASAGDQTNSRIKQNIRIVPAKEETRAEEDMLMCETSSVTDKNVRIGRKYDTLQILFAA